MRLALPLALALMTLPAAAPAFEITFTWGDIKLCTSGRPNTVPNPTFTLKDVPEGTTFIKFQMVDLDYRPYNHGGGTIAYSGQSTIAPGAFKYKSPCPPGGTHNYEWTATAQSKKSGGKLGTAKARRDYPE